MRNSGGGGFDTSIQETTLDAAWKGIGARRIRARRMRRAKILLAPVFVAALAVLIFVFAPRRTTTASPVETTVLAAITLQGGAPLPNAWENSTNSTSSTTIAFDEGSRITLSKNGRLVSTTRQDQPTRVDLVLEKGDATFDITPGGPRAWIIDAGNGTRVRVLGTRFTVTRDGRHVHVAVQRGKVRVESSNAQLTRDLIAGQEVDVGGSVAPEAPPTAATEDPALSVIPVENLAPPKPASSKPTSRKTAAHDEPASGAAPASTPAAAPAPTPTPTPTPARDRFAEADAARKAGDPRQAVAILKEAHANNDHAALAAFTIGKIHVDELSDPSMAATWFGRAIQQGGLPSGLEEDAYARVVECHGQAGHGEEAARAAERYEAKFPNGRHHARVQRWNVKR